ncbi:hypothetical protein [Aquimarina sp. RZ0]|uniref:hypothetical protein n=1 Tax=Aquimarina sp. RZ0 TaxID=2607730 RepID=UPI0011F10923|nr:hypothetical protein [Aquimarina sp. RZ0]KAA1246712.1 hypothetical protein F0000_06625 [Aquimarina sp. RZ0]
MNRDTNPYRKHLIKEWLFSVLLLCSVTGYSNYNQPLCPEVTTELVIKNQRSSSRPSVSFKTLYNKGKSIHIFEVGLYVNWLSKFHTILSTLKDKEYNTLISLSNIYTILLPHRNSYDTEGNSFHVTFV